MGKIHMELLAFVQMLLFPIACENLKLTYHCQILDYL